MRRHYTGIGSRETPDELKPVIAKIAIKLRELGYDLWSGGAPGADTFFEENAGDNKQIFLPWRGFNKNQSPFYEASKLAWEMAARFHPTWDTLTDAEQKFMARNSHQVFGPNMDEKTEFIVCWTPFGKPSGGTGQALRIAREYKIPIFNLARPGDFDELWTRITIPPLF